MLKKVNNIANFTMGVSTILLIIGIMLVILPDFGESYGMYILGISLIVLGIILIYHSSWKLVLLNYASFGILQILLGGIIMLYPNLFAVIVPVSIGTWMVIKASVDFRVSLILKKYNNKDWMLVTISSILAVLCGCVLIIDPNLGSITITGVVGIFLVVYCTSSILNSLIIKNNTKDIIKELKLIDR